MKKFSDDNNWNDLREKVIGLGETSIKKSYYPELQKRLEDLEKFRSLLDQTNDIIFLLEIPAGKINDVNMSSCKMLGYSYDELKALSFHDLIDTKNSEEFKQLFQINPEEIGKTRIIKTIIKRKDLKEIPVEMTVRIAKFGDCCYGVIVARDITERVISEEEKRKLELKLRENHKMEALGRLAGGVAHDFNNILFGIIGYGEIAINDLPDNCASKEYLAQLLCLTGRAKELVKQILTFSRKNKPEKKSIRIREIVLDTIKLMELSIPSSIKIVKNINSESSVLIDTTHLTQIVMNLCTNGVHAMRDSGGILEITLEDIEKPPEKTSFVNLTVEDSGEGIKSELVAKIFDPYFTTKKAGEGTGLGLSIVHGIVKSCGGDIGVTSREGEGSKFEILLPVSTETF